MVKWDRIALKRQMLAEEIYKTKIKKLNKLW